LVSWSILGLLADLWVRLEDLRFNWRLLIGRSTGYVGGLFAHIGILLCIAAFLGNYRGLEKTVTLKTGESTEFYTYVVKFDGLKTRRVENAMQVEAPLKLVRASGSETSVTPARSKYPTKDEFFHEVGLNSAFWHDFYAVLSDFRKGNEGEKDRVTLQLHINPTVRLVWYGVMIMCLGGLISLFDKGRGNRSKDAFVST
jgi:cytochrome c biogenesis factor